MKINALGVGGEPGNPTPSKDIKQCNTISLLDFYASKKGGNRTLIEQSVIMPNTLFIY